MIMNYIYRCLLSKGALDQEKIFIVSCPAHQTGTLEFFPLCLCESCQFDATGVGFCFFFHCVYHTLILDFIKS